MSRFAFFIVTILIGLFYILHFDKFLADRFTAVNSFKKFYVKKADTIGSNINSFFSQADKIKELTKTNQELFKYLNLYTSANSDLTNLQNNTTTLHPKSEELQITRVLSYVNFNDFTKVWLDIPKKDNKIQGLIDGQYSAGIVIQKANKAQALLNGNKKSNYAVFIGETKAPGIIHNNKHKDLLSIKYIPIWININIGDEVITSGMDNIFFEGLKVGKVVSINKMADQQEAYIRPYSKVLQKKVFFIYDKKTTEKESNKSKVKKNLIKKPNKKP